MKNKKNDAALARWARLNPELVKKQKEESYKNLCEALEAKRQAEKKEKK